MRTFSPLHWPDAALTTVIISPQTLGAQPPEVEKTPHIEREPPLSPSLQKERVHRLYMLSNRGRDEK